MGLAIKSSHIEGIPRAFSEETVNGEPNPLAKAHISVPTANPPAEKDTRRFPGDPSELPTSSQINFALSLSDYGDFSDELEGIHDGVHVWVGGIGGDMASVPFAATGILSFGHIIV